MQNFFTQCKKENTILLVIAFVVVCVVGFFTFRNRPITYVRGIHGSICYPIKGGVPKTVTHPMYFTAQDNCLNSFGVNK